MVKYNVKEKAVKDPAYRKRVSKEMGDQLKKLIIQKIVTEKKYKDPEYSAKKLAADINTNTRYISAVFNVKMNCNYSEFVNKQRVNEAMEMLIDKNYKDKTMVDIAKMVGFKNRQSFYAAFYRFNKTSPHEFKVSQQKD